MNDEIAQGLAHAELKAQWANKRARDLQAFIKAFIDTKPYTVTLDHDTQTSDYQLKIGMTQPMPAAIPLIVAEILHAQRTALDYLWMALVRSIDPGNAKQTFPFQESVDLLKKTIVKTFKSDPVLLAKIEGLFLNEIKAYSVPTIQGPIGKILYELKELDNWDKHNLLIVMLGVTSIDEVRMDGDNFEDVVVKDVQVTGDGQVTLVELRCAENLKITNEPKPTFEIMLGKHRTVDGGPLFPLLIQFSETLRKVHELFKRDFS